MDRSIRARTAVDDDTRTLIIRAQADDASALEELFRRYRERLRSALRRLLGERYRRTIADSEDAVQDAILAALRGLSDFEYRGEGSFLAWLLKRAEYEIRQRVRAMAAQKRAGRGDRPFPDTLLPARPAAGTPSEIASARELEEQIALAIDRLPARERDVIILRRYLGLDLEEIRAELDLPTPGAVRALLSRAQARLAALLSETHRES
jgi:RNA polymerase sigma-70 factor (ECF subfamily)